MLRIPGMPALVAMSLLGFTSFFLTLSSLPVYAVGQGVPEALAGLVTTVMLVATVACQLLVPTAVRRIGQPATLAVGLVALGAPTPLLLLRDELWWLLLLSAIRGLGFAILTVLTPLVATQIAPPGSHGRAIGLYGLAVAVPNIFAVPAAVALTEAGHFAVVAVLGAVPLVAVPLVGRFPKPPPRGERRAGAAHPGDVAGLRARKADRGAPQRTAENRRREAAGAVVRGGGIGDILGEQAMALLMPLHSRAQHRQDRKSALPLPHYWADFTGQTLPRLWLTPG